MNEVLIAGQRAIAPYLYIMRFVLLFIVFWAGAAPASPLRILAVGDSVLAWHAWTGRDIPSQMGEALGAAVENRAVSGARFVNAPDRRSVMAQYAPGSWDVVLMNGGANDLLALCGCSACDSILDRLISADLTGAVPEFVDRARQGGAEVIWMGYYASYRSGRFAGCRPYLVEFDARMARLAARTPGLVFVDSEDVIDAGDRSLFALDGIHPSPKAARRIGAFLARNVMQ